MKPKDKTKEEEFDAYLEEELKDFETYDDPYKEEKLNKGGGKKYRNVYKKGGKHRSIVKKP